MSKQLESAAYHEVGQITAAVARGLPIRAAGLNIDLYGHGCDLDQQQRKHTIIALYAAQFAQLKFYPALGSWELDLAKIAKLTLEMNLNEAESRVAQEELREQARTTYITFRCS